MGDMQIEELVKRKIESLKTYPFFKDFMEAELPHNDKFLEELKLFFRDLKGKGFTYTELALLKKLPELAKHPKEQRYGILQTWMVSLLTSEIIKFEIVKNPVSRNLRDFYEIYKSIFPPEEQTPIRDYMLYILKEHLASRFVNFFLKNEWGHRIHTNYYVMVVKVKGIVVGGATFNTINTEETSFIVVEYVFVVLDKLRDIKGLEGFSHPSFRWKLANGILERCIKIAFDDAKKYGHNEPFFILSEVNNPVKMYEEGILNPEYDIENPVVRLRAYQMYGYYFLDYPYIQPDIGEGEADYMYSAIKPLAKEWIEEIKKYNSVDSAKFEYALFTYLCTWKGPQGMVNTKTNHACVVIRDYLDNLIKQGKKLRVNNFRGLGIPSEVVKACKQIKWRVEDDA